MEVGWDSLPWLPAATESRSPRGSRLYVSSAMPSPPWLGGARTRPGRQVRLRLRSTLFATHSAPLQPRPVTFRSPTFFERRARGKVRVFWFLFFVFSFLFFWRPGEGREPRGLKPPELDTLAGTDSTRAPSGRGGKAGSIWFLFFAFFFFLLKETNRIRRRAGGEDLFGCFPVLLLFYVCLFVFPLGGGGRKVKTPGKKESD